MLAPNGQHGKEEERKACDVPWIDDGNKKHIFREELENLFKSLKLKNALKTSTYKLMWETRQGSKPYC